MSMKSARTPERTSKMATPVCKLWMNRPREAFYQLSEEQLRTHQAKVEEAMEKVGAKTLVLLNTAWSVEQWAWCGVTEFPDIGAVQKYVGLLQELGHYRYIEALTILGTKTEVS